MANYYGMARTNYFQVKDEEAFRQELAQIPDLSVWVDRGYDGLPMIPTRYAVGCGEAYGGPGWNFMVPNPNPEPRPEDYLNHGVQDDGTVVHHLTEGYEEAQRKQYEEDLKYYDTEIDADHTYMEDILQRHLADGEVGVLVEAGFEKMRYAAGYAVAINNQGERRTVNIDEIYDLAKELTTQPQNITPAEY